MVHLIRSILANARGRFSRLVVPLSQQSPSPKPYPRQNFPEEPNEYTHGGYHPVSLGDTFDSKRYSILRKLGYGQRSTVWLARDLKCQRYVALKILRADSYGGPQPIFECEILAKIREVSQRSSHEGPKYISPLLDQFTHGGPNGDHVCLVFDVLGYHLGLQTAFYNNGLLPGKAVKEIIRQVLTGLDFLHRECGVIHSNLEPQNILVELENPSDIISKYLESVPPRTTEGPNGAIVPLQEAIHTPPVCQMTSLRVRIIDFGVSSWREKHLSHMTQPLQLRAPEVTVGAPCDTGVDIWSLGCLVMQFVQSLVPFSGEASESGAYTAEDHQLAGFLEAFGLFPPSLLKQGRRASQYFDEQGKLLRSPLDVGTGDEQTVDDIDFLQPSDMPDDEIYVYLDFLKGMLQLDPLKRKSAAELLQHEWLS
ncbi:hypothetical protein E4U13_004738 [Claviceps humidiphila]|uniref:non-specific serine/threonine protein kinase n=1 Tax=Claviceps humidiphila TaxID=1294629 RepID=A0A9P7PVX0_9HYPO|nr:hypothetical protein E4U13_004738 [Claviceps humidiphila]